MRRAVTKRTFTSLVNNYVWQTSYSRKQIATVGLLVARQAHGCCPLANKTENIDSRQIWACPCMTPMIPKVPISLGIQLGLPL